MVGAVLTVVEVPHSKLADAVSCRSTQGGFDLIDTVPLGMGARPNHVEFVRNARGSVVYASLARIDDGGPGGVASSPIAIIDRSAPGGQRKVVGTFSSRGRESHGLWTNPENTLYAVKRLIGRKFDNEVVVGSYRGELNADGVGDFKLDFKGGLINPINKTVCGQSFFNDPLLTRDGLISTPEAGQIKNQVPEYDKVGLRFFYLRSANNATTLRYPVFRRRNDYGEIIDQNVYLTKRLLGYVCHCRAARPIGDIHGC